MAMVDNYIDIPGLQAGANLSSSQYRAVKMHSTAFQVVAIDNANAPDRPVGILQNDPDTAGHPAIVAFCGLCRAEAGGNISVGDSLALDNNGKVIADAVVTAQDGVDLYHIGIALQAGVDTQIIQILLYPGQPIGKE